MNSLVLKDGVKLYDLSPQIVLAVMVAHGLWVDKTTADLVITSANDSGMKHRERTLHAIGHAIDLRTKNLHSSAAAKQDFAALLWQRLGGKSGSFDVVLEGVGMEHEHIHLEYQPHRAFIG